MATDSRAMGPQVKARCEAVVLRYVHDLTTQEFVNVGVVLLCPDLAFVGARFLPSWTRGTTMFPDADAVHLRRIASRVSDTLDGWAERWRSELRLSEPPSSASTLVAQLAPSQESGLLLSEAITGVTSDPERTLSELFARYVGKFLARRAADTREDGDIWRGFEARFPTMYVNSLQPHKVTGPRYAYEFQHAWQNGVWNAAQPLSLDLRESRTILEKACTWVGRIKALEVSPTPFHVAFLVGLPGPDKPRPVQKAARDGAELLAEQLDGIAEVFRESESARLAAKIADDIQHRIDGAFAGTDSE